MKSTPIMKARFLAIDLEMTGVNPSVDEIIEIAAIPISAIEIGTEEAFYSEVAPERNIPADSKAIHGIHGKELAIAPPLYEVMPQVTSMLKGRIIVGHGVREDLLFLRAKAKTAGVIPPTRPAVDTMEIARYLEPANKKGMSLDELLEYCAMKPRDTVHNALTDAILASRVFIRLLAELKKQNVVRDVKDLLSIGGVEW